MKDYYKILTGPRAGEVVSLPQAKNFMSGMFLLLGRYHKDYPDNTVFGQDADEGLIAKIDGEPVVVQEVDDPGKKRRDRFRKKWEPIKKKWDKRNNRYHNGKEEQTYEGVFIGKSVLTGDEITGEMKREGMQFYIIDKEGLKKEIEPASFRRVD